jgi:hypothetical protein
MWMPNKPAEEDVSDPGIDLQSKRQRSRRRAWRHGLADQTVVKTFEDIRSYRALERALISSIDPRSVVEFALGHRLASLLWRPLRRANAIETGLFEIKEELLLACRRGPSRGSDQLGTLATPTRANGHGKIPRLNNAPPDQTASDDAPLSTSVRLPLGPWSTSRTPSQCFLRLSNLDPTLLDRVGRYETRLWRQAAQTIWTLEAMRTPTSNPGAIAPSGRTLQLGWGKRKRQFKLQRSRPARNLARPTSL